MALVRDAIEIAAGHYRDGLVLGWEVGFAVGMAYNLQGLAWLGSRRGDFARAARFVGAIDAVGGTVQQLPGITSESREADLATARAALGEAAFTAARDAGRTHPLEETIAEATALADELMTTPHRSLRSAPSRQ